MLHFRVPPSTTRKHGLTGHPRTRRRAPKAGSGRSGPSPFFAGDSPSSTLPARRSAATGAATPGAHLSCYVLLQEAAKSEFSISLGSGSASSLWSAQTPANCPEESAGYRLRAGAAAMYRGNARKVSYPSEAIINEMSTKPQKRNERKASTACISCRIFLARNRR